MSEHGERLKRFITENYGSLSEFAVLLGVDKSEISRCIKNESYPRGIRLKQFLDLGLSINWYLNCIGDMYAQNAKGQELFKKSLEDKERRSPQVNRLHKWLLNNYETVENFCHLWKIDQFIIFEIFLKNKIPNSQILLLFEEAGCNIKWIIHGEGFIYAENICGHLFRLNSYNDNHRIWQFIHEDRLEELKNLSKEELYKLILFTNVEVEKYDGILNEIQKYIDLFGHNGD
jgi:hypothetical protein